MYKIGVLTLTGEFNYGNKLQNYAMEQVLKTAGFTVETIRVANKSYRELYLRTYVQHLLRRFLSPARRQRIDRKMKFLVFNNHINQSKIYISPRDTEAEINQKLKSFDFLVYGSDQIWNPEFASFSDIYLGKYAEKEKNIAVSASIGIPEIPEQYVPVFGEGLQRFKSVSVREEAGKKAIEKLLPGLQIETLIDPTLMLTAEQWEAVEMSVQVPAQYYLTYLLGKKDDFPNGYFEKICEGERVDAGQKENYGPGEFIYLIRNANGVVTDSFHAAVFSLIFGKELYILQRVDGYSSMSSRIETLIAKTGVRYEKKDGLVHIFKDALYEAESLKNVETERNKFKRFIADNIWLCNVKSACCDREG